MRPLHLATWTGRLATLLKHMRQIRPSPLLLNSRQPTPSQSAVFLLALVARLTYTKMRFRIAGDFNQYSPIGNCWRGSPIADEAFERSALLHRLCGGRLVNLTECRRADSVLFDFYGSLIAGGSRFEIPLCEAIKQAQSLFHHAGSRGLQCTAQRAFSARSTANPADRPNRRCSRAVTSPPMVVRSIGGCMSAPQRLHCSSNSK